MEQQTLLEQFLSKWGPEVKPREGNNIRLKCPECGHKSLACDIQTGLVHCFQCHFGKGLRFKGLATGFQEQPVDPALHVQVSKKLIEISELLPLHKEYLVKRGIYNPEALQIKSVPLRVDKLLLEHFSEEDLISSGYFYKTTEGYSTSKALAPRRLLIPFWRGNEIIGIKSRIRPYADETSEEVRYIAPRGSKVRNEPWYFGKLGPDVIITEGELAAAAAAQVGIPTIGIAGLALATTDVLQDKIKYILRQHGVKRVFIIFDTDPGIAFDIGKLTASVAMATSIGDTASIVYLPQDRADECMDLDLFLSRNSLDDLLDLMEDAWPRRKATLKGLRQRINNLEHTTTQEHTV